MKKNIYFLDFENLQSTESELENILDDTCEIYLFHGAHQNNFPAFWVKTAIELGQRLHIVQLKESANNALDFLIAYYIGKLSHEADYAFHIISNDKGYDPLIDHLTEQGRNIDRISRQKQPSEPSKIKESLQTVDPELLQLAKVVLLKTNRPTRKDKLINVIKSSAVFGRYTEEYDLPDAEEFIQNLQLLQWFTIDQNSIIYNFPAQSSPQTAQAVKTQISQVLSPKMAQQIQNIFSKANRPSKEKSLRSVIESSVITQKDNLTNLSTDEVIQYLILTKAISIHAGVVSYQAQISQPLLNQNYEKCQKIYDKIDERSRPATVEKYISSIKSWTQCTHEEAIDIFKRLKKNNKIIL